MNTIWDMPCAAPEAVGIPSQAIRRFLRRLEDRGLSMHDVLVMRNDLLVAEAYWKPFAKQRRHRMYSTTKSFTSAAIGILIGEGKLRLSDPVANFFPELLPEKPSPWMLKATVRDLLRMATPIDQTSHHDHTADWAASFFQSPASHMPGRIFRYDTSGTSTLCILIQRITGLELTEYLKGRLFRPAGMSEDIRCIRTNCGHDWGGSGLLCLPRDLVRFAQVCMHGGRWEGRQLIPEAYIRAATQRQIDNSMPNSCADKQQGYGYQFWCLRRGGFAMLGMGSQNVLCLPEKNLIVVTNADTQPVVGADSAIFDAFWELAGALEDSALPPDPEGAQGLDQYIQTLSLRCAQGAPASPAIDRINGRRYSLPPNALGFRNLRFDFSGDTGALTYENDTGAHVLRFGFSRQVTQAFPETHYYGERIGTAAGYGYECHASAAWKDEHTLTIECRLVDIHVGTLQMQFSFDGNTVAVYGIKHAEWFLEDYAGFASGASGDAAGMD